MKTILIGLGNELLAEDAAGLLVARTLADRLLTGSVKIEESQRGGLSVVELMRGYARAILVDAIMTGDAAPGTIHAMTAAKLPRATHRLGGSHEIGLPEALEIAGMSGWEIPEAREIMIYGIEIADNTTIGGELSIEVAEAVRDLAGRLAADLAAAGRAGARPDA